MRHSQRVNSAAFTPDNKVVTAGADGTVRLWDPAMARPIAVLPETGRVDSIALSPDGMHLAAGLLDQNPVAAVFDISNFPRIQKVSQYASHDGSIHGVTFFRDGSRVASGSVNSMVAIWDGTNGKALQTFKASGPVYSLVFTPDDRYLIAHSYAKSVTVWDVASNQQACAPLEHGEIVRQIAVDAHGKLLATVGGKAVRVWNLSTGQQEGPLLSHSDTVHAATFCGDGRLVTVGNSGYATLWDLEHRREVTRMNQGGVLRWTAYNAATDGLVTTSPNGTIRVWNASDGSPDSPVLHHPLGAPYAIFAPTGKLLMTTGDDRSVRLWNPSTGFSSRLRATRATQNRSWIARGDRSPMDHRSSGPSSCRTEDPWCGALGIGE